MNTPIFLCQCLIRVHIFSFHHLQNYIYIYIYEIKMTVLTLQAQTNQIKTCREIKVYTCWNHKVEVKRKSFSLSLSPPPPFYILNKRLPRFKYIAPQHTDTPQTCQIESLFHLVIQGSFVARLKANESITAGSIIPTI